MSNKTEYEKDLTEKWVMELFQWADECNISESKIPRNVDKLLHLDNIDLSSLGLKSISRQLCFLKNITTLILENNNITELPKEIINLKRLKKLNLQGNVIIFNPNQEIWIKRLETNNCQVILERDWEERLIIWAEKNDIPDTVIPRDKKELIALTHLDLENYLITTLPNEICNLTRLVDLSLPDNSNFKLNTKHLLWLYKLSWYRPAVTAMNRDWFNTNAMDKDWMKKLFDWANENNIPDTVIPRDKEELIALDHLELSKKNLTKLPKEIGNLINLTYIDFDDNNLSEVPKKLIRNIYLNAYHGKYGQTVVISIKNNPNLELSDEDRSLIERLSREEKEYNNQLLHHISINHPFTQPLKHRYGIR